MKRVLYKDREGFIRRSLIKDGDDESDAPFGIPDGPPDVRLIDWDTLMRDVNNVLAENNAFTWEEALKYPVALQAAIGIFKRHLINLYRENN